MADHSPSSSPDLAALSPRAATATACRAGSTRHGRAVRRRAAAHLARRLALRRLRRSRSRSRATSSRSTVDSTPVLVMRDDDGEVRAFHNVCRHRGTQLCREDSGHVRAIVCPYHSWTYSRQGDLIACHGMQDGRRQVAAGLEAAARRGRRGLDLRVARRIAAGVRRLPRAIRPSRRAAGLRSREASPRSSTTRSTPTGSSSGRTTASASTARAPPAVRQGELRRLRRGVRVRRRYSNRWPRPSRARNRSGRRRGIAITHPARRPGDVPDPDRDLWYAADRTVLAEGFDTESMDGKRVAPLMGDYRGRRRRRAADAQPAELLGARELRSRRRRAAAARRSAHDRGARLLAGATRTPRRRGLQPR